MENTVRRNAWYWMDQIAYVLLGIILFDCIALGGGSYVKIKGIDIRMVWFALFFITSLPAVFRNLKKMLANTYALCLLVWLVWLVIAAVRGIRIGNDVSVIISGLIGFASFVILPGAMAILTDKRRITGLMAVAVVASVVLSLQTVVLLFMHNLDGESLVRINNQFLAIELGSLSIVDANLVRIFLRGHPLAIFGCGCAVYFAAKTDSKGKRLLYSLATAWILFSLLVSFTRSVYLAAFVAVVFLMGMLLWILDKAARKRLLKWLGATLIMFIVVLQIFNMVFGTYFLSYGIYRSVGFDLAGTFRSKLSVSLCVDLTPVPTEPTVPEETKETEPEETKPKETKPKETKPKETEPKETEPQETKPQETKPQETEPKAVEPVVDINKLSDDLRTATRQELIARIKEHPILGSGMGTVLEVRANRDKVNEYFYLDQALKTGITGIFLYMLPMLLMLCNLLLRKKHMDRDDVAVCSVWMAGLLAVAVFSYYNPYLNGSSGISLYCCTIAAMSTLNGKQQLRLKKK